ncbi:hypothetical protein [Phytohabitans suffuscus]
MATPFLNLMGSQPVASTAAATEVGAAAANINNLANLIRTAASVAGWKGASQGGQQQSLGQFMTLFQQLLTSMTQIQATAGAGAAQLQVAKLTTEATVTAAQSGRYVVAPTGTVQPGPWHYSFASTHPGSMGVFRAVAGMLTAQINASVGQSKAVDTQVAAAIAQVALDYLGGWLDAKLFPPSAGAGTAPSTVVPGTIPGTTVPGPPPGTGSTVPAPLPGGVPTTVTVAGTDPGLTGTGLAGAAGLGTATLGGAGVHLGAGGPGGFNAPLAGTGVMLGGGAAGAAAGGVIGAAGGGAARGAAGATPMVPYGGGAGAGGAGGGDRPERRTELAEDEEPWEQGEAPDAVLR